MITVKLLSLSLCFLTMCYSLSPCPDVFRYLIHDKTQEVYGRIEIPHPPQNAALHLRVSFSIATVLPTQYVGKLELARSRSDSIKAIQQGLSLIYNIFFPLTRPIPQLTEIKFNNRQYCIGQRVLGPIVTNIFLEHFLYPPGVNTLPTDSKENILPPLIIPTITPWPLPVAFKPPSSKMISHSIGSSSHSENCGKPREPINFLIAKGQKNWPGQWPWLVAIFVTRKKIEFQCAGSLISDRHILTAAHCRWVNGQEMPVNNFVVSLGRHYLDNWRDENIENFDVADIRIHPEYKNNGNAHADLALLIVRNKVIMNLIIQPLCLWSGPTNLETIVNHSGYVVGWGRDEKGSQHLAEPRLAQVPIVSQEDCLRSNIGFIQSTSNKTFCAGHRDGRGPCNGDSGSALVIFNPLSGRYYLRGVVSLSILDRETLTCDLTQYVVYVDAAKYTDWIEEQIFNTQ